MRAGAGLKIKQSIEMIREVGLSVAVAIQLEKHRITLLRILAAIGVLAFVVGVSLLIALKDPLYGIILTILPFGVAFFLFMEERLYLTPVIILAAAAFVPFSLPTGTGSRLVISLILAAGLLFLWVFRMAVFEKKIRLRRSPINAPVLGFCAVVLVSWAWSNLFRDPLLFVPNSFVFVQAASAVIMIVSPGLLLFMANQVTDEKWLKWMAWIMLASGAVGILANLLSINLPANTGGQASMWIVGLCVSIALCDARTPKFTRGLFLVLAALWVYWGFIRNLSWIAGWLPVFVSGGVILFIRSKRLLLVCSILLLMYLLLNTQIIESWFGQETLTSGDTRLLAWQINWRFTSQHLLFGMGPAGYAVYYMTYYPLDAMATHNNYIDLLSQTGIVGSAFYLAALGVLTWRGVVVYLRVKGQRNFIEALSLAALGGTVGCIVIMAFGDWLLPFAYTQTIAGFNYTVYNWLFMGTILSLDAMTSPARQSEPAGEG